MRRARLFRGQAYDGHMNLILSDVEETIMIVDSVDNYDGQGTVKAGENVGRREWC